MEDNNHQQEKLEREISRLYRVLVKLQQTQNGIRHHEIEDHMETECSMGEIWCGKLKLSGNISKRLIRGWTYSKKGLVIDLQIKEGRIHAFVCGSEIYHVEITIKALSRDFLTDFIKKCSREALRDLIMGNLPESIVEITIHKDEGLFPKRRDLSVKCTCPDWKTVCKHVAATLYEVAYCLDRNPDLLLSLRGIDTKEVAEIAADQAESIGRKRISNSAASKTFLSLSDVDFDWNI